MEDDKNKEKDYWDGSKQQEEQEEQEKSGG